MNGQRLKDRVIVIVGGTSRLGLSAASACVAHGARVVIVGRNDNKCEAAEQQLGERVRAVTGDATDPQTGVRAIQVAIETFGDLTGLYHVAGGSGRSRGDGPLHEITDAGWSYTQSLNADSMFYSNRAATQAFLKLGHGGSILNMSSVLADSPSPRYFATHAYATTKAAAVGLTKAAAAYYASRDIRFNAIAPALVDTPLAARAMSKAYGLPHTASQYMSPHYAV